MFEATKINIQQYINGEFYDARIIRYQQNMFCYNKELGLFINNQIDNQEKLLVLNWNVTGQCLNLCTYCYGKDIRFMPGLSDQALVSLTRNLAILKPDLIVISGGEPLLFPSLSFVINFFLNKNINLVLDTSGVIQLEILKPFLNQIHTRISLDGVDDKINESTRISPIVNSTNKVKDQIIMLAKCQYPVTVQTTITDTNTEHLFELASFLTKCNVKNWRLSFVIPHSEKFEQKVKPIINSLINSFPLLNIRISNCNSESNDHVILIDPNGNIMIRNTNNNSKTLLGNLSDASIDRHLILDSIDSYEHIRRYSLRKRNNS